MKLKTFAIAAMLVMGAASAAAQKTRSFTETFTYLGPAGSDAVQLLGFGRGGDVKIDPTATTLLRAPAPEAMAARSGFSPLLVGTPGPFHDFWEFNGLRPGTFSFDTVINAAPDTTFNVVVLQWIEGNRTRWIDFTIDQPGMQTARGTGTFTVDPSCSTEDYCVSMHIYGWDEGLSTSGYGARANVQVVPEPTTGAMLLAGLGALGWLARRRRA